MAVAHVRDLHCYQQWGVCGHGDAEQFCAAPARGRQCGYDHLSRHSGRSDGNRRSESLPGDELSVLFERIAVWSAGHAVWPEVYFLGGREFAADYTDYV